MNQEQKEAIERARKLQEEFQKLGENIDPIWMLLSEVRGMREEMREGMRGMREEGGGRKFQVRAEDCHHWLWNRNYELYNCIWDSHLSSCYIISRQS